MVARTLLLTALVLAGCASQDPIVIHEPVEVRVPVPVRAEPPEELLTPYRPGELPTFISPDDPAAAAALSEESLGALRRLLRDLSTRDAAWRAWAQEPLPEAQ